MKNSAEPSARADHASAGIVSMINLRFRSLARRASSARFRSSMSVNSTHHRTMWPFASCRGKAQDLKPSIDAIPPPQTLFALERRGRSNTPCSSSSLVACRPTCPSVTRVYPGVGPGSLRHDLRRRRAAPHPRASRRPHGGGPPPSAAMAASAVARRSHARPGRAGRRLPAAHRRDVGPPRADRPPGPASVRHLDERPHVVSGRIDLGP